MGPEELLRHDQCLAKAPLSVPGDIIENVYIPARGFMKARKLEKGNILRIVDLEGHQVPDVIFFDADNLKDVSSCIHTCVVHQRWKIRKGDAIYSKHGKRMATITEDTVGIHFFGGGFCNADLNAVRFGIEGTHTCRSNLAASMSRHGLREDDLELDSCLNFFMNLAYNPDGSFVISPCPAQAGDYVDLLAEMNIIVAISNCPQERNPCNDWNSTALRAVFFRGEHS